MDYTALGDGIRKRRLERGWRIADLADKVGVSEDYIGKIERADGVPSLQTTIAIANVLNVGIDVLLSEYLTAVDAPLCEEVNELLAGMSPVRRKLFLQFVKDNLTFFNKVADLNPDDM